MHFQGPILQATSESRTVPWGGQHRISVEKIENTETVKVILNKLLFQFSEVINPRFFWQFSLFTSFHAVLAMSFAMAIAVALAFTGHATAAMMDLPHHHPMHHAPADLLARIRRTNPQALSLDYSHPISRSVMPPP